MTADPERSGPALEAGPLAGAGTNPPMTSSTDVDKGSAKLSQTCECGHEQAHHVAGPPPLPRRRVHG